MSPAKAKRQSQRHKRRPATSKTGRREITTVKNGQAKMTTTLGALHFGVPLGRSRHGKSR